MKPAAEIYVRAAEIAAREPEEILFFDGPVGHWKWLLLIGGVSVLLFLAGYWLFDRLRDSFAEAV